MYYTSVIFMSFMYLIINNEQQSTANGRATLNIPVLVRSLKLRAAAVVQYCDG